MGYDYDTCSRNIKSYHLGDVFIETSKRLVSGICKKKKKGPSTQQQEYRHSTKGHFAEDETISKIADGGPLL